MELIHEKVVVTINVFSRLLHHSWVELCKEDAFVTNGHVKCNCLLSVCPLCFIAKMNKHYEKGKAGSSDRTFKDQGPY